MYVGPPLGLDDHSGSVSCLAVAVDGTFTLRFDERSAVGLQSAWIPARLIHRVVAEADLMTFCFFDPGSAWDRGCRLAMTQTDGPIAFRHRDEATLVREAGSLTSARSAGEWVGLATGGQSELIDEQRCDPRIARAVAELNGLGPQDKRSASELAVLVGLSYSRFLHLFHDQTGTTFRRYRLWLRMWNAAALLAGDVGDLTTAAVESGFASPSHLSSAFHAMFGLAPSHLLGVEICLVR